MNIQIFGKSKSFDTKKAERWFKERRIKYQYIDLASKGVSAGEYRSIKAAVGSFDALVDKTCRAYEDQYMAYITPDAAEEKLLAMLPDELRPTYSAALSPAAPEIQQLVKAADKLSAYIKCLEELKAGNTEFKQAAEQTRYALDDMELPELDYFLENFLPSFKLTLDELE